MRSLIAILLLCATLFGAGRALAGPRSQADADWRQAEQLYQRGDYKTALATTDHGLAAAPPKDLQRRLLGLRGAVLLKLRDYAGALAAYQAYLAAGATGENRRQALNIVKILGSVESTRLDITVSSGPAAVYLDSKTEGVFCTADPSCLRPVLPGDYKLIVERDGFERWTGRVTPREGQTARLAATLVEKPSLLTVRVTPPGASVTVDDTAYTAPATIAAGRHQIAASLAGHVADRREVEVHEGKPAEVEVALAPLVPIRVAPLQAELALDGRPVAIDHGGVAIAQGSHVLVVRAPGFHDRRIDVPAVPAAEYDRAADYELAVELDRVAPAPRPIESSPLPGRRKLALAVGGAAPLAAVVGVMLGLESGRLNDEAASLCPSPSTPCSSASTADELNRRARSRALGANVAYGVAGAAAITAAILWFTGAPEPRVAVIPRTDGAGLDLTVRY